jgi:hypothetical protein
MTTPGAIRSGTIESAISTESGFGIATPRSTSFCAFNLAAFPRNIQDYVVLMFSKANYFNFSFYCKYAISTESAE